MSKRTLRVFSREFKHRLMRRLGGASEWPRSPSRPGVKPQLLYDWRAA